MFDLFRSREKAVRYLLGAMLILVAISMLTYLIPSYNFGVTGDNPVVAEIGKDRIMLLEVQRAIQNIGRTRNIPPAALAEYVPQIINQLITERALVYEAKRLGMEVTDQDVADSIRTIIPGLFQDGKFVGKDVYAAMLAQQNMTIDEFERTVARQALVRRLDDIASQSVVVTPLEVEQEFRKRNEKLKIDYVKLANDQFKSQVQVSPEEMKKEYETNKGAYQTPEKRTYDVLLADPAKMAASIRTPEAELRRFYDQNKDRFRSGDRVKVRHILLNTVGKSADEEQKIRAKAEDLRKQIKSGADFAELARKNSEDPGSAAKGGDLDWVVRGQTVPEFEKTAFALKPNETSDAIKTQYGYHIIQTLQKEDARLRPFEEVKDEIAVELNKTRLNDAIQSAADTAQVQLRKDVQHPEKVAADLNLQLIHATNVVQTAPLPELGVAQEIQTAAFSTAKNEVSQPIVLANNRLVLVVVKDIQPAHVAPFQEVQDQVRQNLVNQKVSQLLDAKAQELTQKVKAEGGDLRKAAKAMGLETKTSEEFTRFGSIEGLGTAGMFASGFTQPVGAVIGPVNFGDFRVVAKSLARQDASMTELAAQREGIRNELKGKKVRERSSLLTEGLRQQLVKEGKIKVHEDVVRRMVQNYRG